MKELIAEIEKAIVKFSDNAEKNLEGNKAAGVRARKASKELEKLFKEYRKRSLSND